MPYALTVDHTQSITCPDFEVLLQYIGYLSRILTAFSIPSVSRNIRATLSPEGSFILRGCDEEGKKKKKRKRVVRNDVRIK